MYHKHRIINPNKDNAVASCHCGKIILVSNDGLLKVKTYEKYQENLGHFVPITHAKLLNLLLV